MKVAQKALKSCDTASLIECYEDFERRPLKELAHAVREEEEESREDEELVIRVFFSRPSSPTRRNPSCPPTPAPPSARVQLARQSHTQTSCPR